MLDLPGNTRHFNPVPNGDRSLGQDHQATDEIAGDVLQPEADAHANRACENRQRAQVNAGVFQNNQNADYQHDVGDDLGNGVLEGAIQSALSQ